MPYAGSRRRSGTTCRCPLCDYELEVDEGERCELFDCPRHHTPLQESGISQTPRWGPGRKSDEGSKIPWGQGPVSVKECRCPNCDYTEVIEEGARCLNSVCPECGSALVPI